MEDCHYFRLVDLTKGKEQAHLLEETMHHGPSDGSAATQGRVLELGSNPSAATRCIKKRYSDVKLLRVGEDVCKTDEKNIFLF